MSEESQGALAELFQRIAADLGDVRSARTGVATEYQRGDRLFALATDDVVEVRLTPDVAAAAARTPDAGPSAKGGGWVSFAPRSVDRFALDRAESWFLFAWRSAES